MNGIRAGAITTAMFLSIAVSPGCGPAPPRAVDRSISPDTAESPPTRRGEGSEADDSDIADSGAVNPLKIALTMPEITDGNIAVTLEATNRGTAPIIWDREFSVFLTWHVRTNDDGPELSEKWIEEIKDERGEGLRERFGPIKPGETLRKRIELTTSIRLFVHQRKSIATPDGGSEVVPVGGEQLARYVIPAESRILQISVEYNGDDFDAQDGFAVHFLERPESFGIARGRARSNEVRLKLR